MNMRHGRAMCTAFIHNENVLSFIHTATIQTQNIWTEVGQEVSSADSGK